MNRRIKIVIFVDNAKRDLFPSMLLKKRFEEKGFRAYLCNKRNFKVKLRKVQPDVFIISRADLPFARDVAKCCRLYVVPSEGGRLTPETMMSVFLGRTYNPGILSTGKKIQLDQHYQEIKSFDFIRRVYLWGSSTREFLIQSGFFRPEQLLVVGNGRLDIYRHMSAEHKKRDQDDFTIVFAFSVKSTSVITGRPEYAKSLYFMDDRSKLPMVRPEGHWEDYAWRDFAILRRMMRIIKKIIMTTNYKICLRVGPLENFDDYKFLEKIQPGRITIQKQEEQLFDFLRDIDVLVTCWSTTGLEALLMDMPVIAIPFLIDYGRLIYHVDPKANAFDTFLRCYHTPKSEDEVLDLIEMAKKRQLSVSADPEYLKELLKTIYNWPSEKSATMAIVDDIIDDLRDYKRQPSKSFETHLPFSRRVEKFLKYTPLPRKILLNMTNTMIVLYFLLVDIRSGGVLSNRSYYKIRNPEVNKLVKITNS